VTHAAFHQDILLKVRQRRLAYQAFFLHNKLFLASQKYIICPKAACLQPPESEFKTPSVHNIGYSCTDDILSPPHNNGTDFSVFHKMLTNSNLTNHWREYFPASKLLTHYISNLYTKRYY
jgi:hypothetical protein